LRAEWSNVTQVGALQTAPILIAVITAFLAMEGVKYLISRRQSAAPHHPSSHGENGGGAEGSAAHA
jgi:hypothetical protein